jgi:hypothetical protein
LAAKGSPGMWYMLFLCEANDGICVTYQQATAKQCLAFEQLPNCEFMTSIMINTDQLHHMTHLCYTYICFFTHFDLIPHQWQIMASRLNSNKQQQNSVVNCSNCQNVNTRHGIWSIQTSYYLWNTSVTHTFAPSLTLTRFRTGDKSWPLGQIGTRNSKTVLGIAATAKMWIHDMDYDQYRPATSYNTLMLHIHLLLHSLWLDSPPVTNHGLWVK